MRDPRPCCHISLQKAEVTCTFCKIFLPNLCGQGCQDAYKEHHCAIPNWHNTKMNVNKSLLEKGRILIISHYLGMPCQLAEPNPGTFSASLHLWDAVSWKKKKGSTWISDSFKFADHMECSQTCHGPPSLHRPETRACKPKGKQVID